MPLAPDTRDYLRMLRAGQNLGLNANGFAEHRIAILADHATQQLTSVFKAAVMELGFYPLVYEADYATAAFEAYNPASELYEFAPDVVWLSFCVQKYRDRFFGENAPGARENLAQTYLDEITGIIDVIAERGVDIMVSNFALPVERQFGNFGLLTQQSLYGSVVAFNRLLADAIGKRKACRLNDIMYLAGRIGSDQFLDERLWANAKYLCGNGSLPAVTRSAAASIAARKGRVTKVIVLDLDNTIWGGVVGDDGIDGIKLGGDAVGQAFQLFQKYILSLKNRGYVLVVCSKNSEDVAMNAFRNHPEMLLREEDVALFVANWNDKASNIEFASRALNLGLDSFIFIDDSPFERGLVKSALPMVAVPEMPEDVAGYIDALESSNLFEATGYSQADMQRSRMYREEALRTTEKIKFGNVDEYLNSLQMTIDAVPFAARDIARVAQLIQRSNQFNLRTQRFSEADCERMMLNPDRYILLQARLSDKFGDYGLICAICAERVGNDLFISELVMSCRVLKRGVEEYLMNRLFAECRRIGAKGIKGEYIESAKNGMVKDFYRQFGFKLLEDRGDRQSWYLAADQYRDRDTCIGQAEP